MNAQYQHKTPRQSIITKMSALNTRNWRLGSIVRSRRIRAFVIVIAMIVVPVCLDKAFIAETSGIEKSLIDDALTGVSLHTLFTDKNKTPLVALDQIEETSQVGISNEYVALLGEVTIPPEAGEFREDSTTSVFSFEMEGTSQDVLEKLSSLWSCEGWRKISMGNLGGATFMKDEGVFRWMLITCTQIGPQVCVVGSPICL